MKIYIDTDFKCHTKPGDGLREFETKFFSNVPDAYIEGYRYVPAGETWVRKEPIYNMDHEVVGESETEFIGEMTAPWKPWDELDKILLEYERTQNRELNAQNAELVDAMASMVEDVYNQDVVVIEGE